MYRMLSNEDFNQLYVSFCEAFSDYQVELKMTKEQFQQRLVRDGVELELSAGAFDDERLVGFYINGRGMWDGKRTAYDAGTGVVPDHRRRGVAEQLFDYMAPRLKELGFAQYLLEVITTNDRAVALYRKLGFEETRTLAVLRADEVLKPTPDIDGVTIRLMDEPDWDVFCAYWDGGPSWQNSADAVDRVRDKVGIAGAFVDEKCVGYGIVYKRSAILMQLAVAPEYRRRGIGSKLLAELSGGGILRTNNVDENLKGTLEFYKARGFEIGLRQFEMIRNL